MVGGVTMSSLLKMIFLMLLLLGVSVQTASYHEMATPVLGLVSSARAPRRADASPTGDAATARATWEVVIEGDGFHSIRPDAFTEYFTLPFLGASSISFNPAISFSPLSPRTTNTQRMMK